MSDGPIDVLRETRGPIGCGLACLERDSVTGRLSGLLDGERVAVRVADVRRVSEVNSQTKCVLETCSIAYMAVLL